MSMSWEGNNVFVIYSLFIVLKCMLTGVALCLCLGKVENCFLFYLILILILIYTCY
jgi:hypothetical protein